MMSSSLRPCVLAGSLLGAPLACVQGSSEAASTEAGTGSAAGEDGPSTTGSGEASSGSGSSGDPSASGPEGGVSDSSASEGGASSSGDESGSTSTGSASGDGGDEGEPPPPRDDAVIVGYFAAWDVYARDYHVADIPAERLTHLNYAFANVQGGRCVLGDSYADVDKAYDGDTWDAGVLRGSFRRLQLLKEAHPHLRTLISVGGWTWSGSFSTVAATAESRATFVASCVDFARTYGFDGIDVDWEYPVEGGLAGNVESPADRENFGLLLADLRAALDAAAVERDEPYLLTIATTARPDRLADNYDLPAQAASVDWFNVMAYDFRGGWEALSGHHAPLHASSLDPTADAARWTVDAAVQAMLDAGVAPEQVVVGIPFYGRGWIGAAPERDGLYQPTTGIPSGTWEAGVFDYVDLAAHHLGTVPRFFDADARVPWLYRESDGLVITYEDEESIGHKVAHVRRLGLRGAMFWELSADRDGTLLQALHGGLK